VTRSGEPKFFYSGISQASLVRAAPQGPWPIEGSGVSLRSGRGWDAASAGQALARRRNRQRRRLLGEKNSSFFPFEKFRATSRRCHQVSKQLHTFYQPL